jgi:hypothetical protein
LKRLGWDSLVKASRASYDSFGIGATLQLMADRALHTFMSLPRRVRLLWFAAAFIALNVSIRLIA